MASDPQAVSPDLIERLFEGVGDAIFATWLDGTIFLWNRRATELFGFTRQEAEGMNLLSLTPGSKLAKEAQRMLDTLHDGQRWEGNIDLRRADGSSFPGRVSAAPAFDEDDKLVAISFLAHDRTPEIRQTEEIQEHARELEHRNEQLRALAVAAMHHFQEPVRDVVAHTQRIERMLTDRPDPAMSEALTIVRDGAMRMRDLAQGLNRYAELAEHESQVEPVDLAELVRRVLDGLAAETETSDAEVHIDPLPAVLGDREDLEAAFTVLLENAIDFRSEEPPRVEITAAARDDMQVIAVADNGIGIDPDLHERIFRPFQRAHSYDQRPGVGLGLTIARELIEAAGGSIWVDSSPGEGATFYVALPAVFGVPAGSNHRSLVSQDGADVLVDGA